MAWERYGEIWDDDGQHTDEQVGNAASARFVNPDLPGRLITVHAFPHAPEILNADCPHTPVLLESYGNGVGRFAPMPDEHDGCTHDLDSLGVQAFTEFMICADVDDPGGTGELVELPEQFPGHATV